MAVGAAALYAGIASTNAFAGEAIESVTVSAGPLPGGTIGADSIATVVQNLGPEDFERLGAANALRALSDSAAGVSISNAQGNPFQPNVTFRGFEGSPLVGDAQGLAVYVNGVRFNQAFGDTVNWDLLPDIAIDRLTVEGSSPAFGLNALGGSISVTTKDGFSYSGTEAELSGGSFGQYREAFQFGSADGNRALYVAATRLDESGWRDHSPSVLGNALADFAIRGNRGSLHLTAIGADTDLTGNGVAPVELLAARRSAVFTYPDRTRNSYGLANLTASAGLGGPWSMTALLYLDGLRQTTRNADASEVEPCDDAPGALCLDDGSIVTGMGGVPIPDFLAGRTYAQLNNTATHTLGYGGAAQAAYEGTLFERADHALFGVAFDHGRSRFEANSQLGAMTPDRGFEGPGTIIDEADGSIAPVDAIARNSYYGLYAANVLDLTPAISLSVSARFNIAEIRLQDEIGTALNGSHRFTRLNPAAGINVKLTPDATFYGGYSEANRAPTPAELSCADEAAPCSLTNFFVGDPALHQVIARSFETGLRGNGGSTELQWRWQASLYRTDSSDDIQFAASPHIGRAFFRNIGSTRRQGLDASLDLHYGGVLAGFGYSYTDASFRSGFTLNSPENPFSDTNGQIVVAPGNRLPGIPRNLFKAQISYAVTPSWSLTIGMGAASGQFLRGDESNLNPQIPGYGTADIGARWRLDDHFELFGTIENLFNAKYATFATFSPTNQIPIQEAPGASDPVSLSPGSPRAFYGGLRVRM